MTYLFLCPSGHLLQGEPNQAGQVCDCPTCGIRFVIPAPVGAGGQDPSVYSQNPYGNPQAGPGGVPGAGQPAHPYGQAEYPQQMQPHLPAQNFDPSATQHPQSYPAQPQPNAGQAPADSQSSVPVGPTPGDVFQTPAGENLATDPAMQQGATAELQISIDADSAGSQSDPFPDVLHIPCSQGHTLDVPRDMLDQQVICPHCQDQFVLLLEKSEEYIAYHEELSEKRAEVAGRKWLIRAIVAMVVVLGGLVALIVLGD